MNESEPETIDGVSPTGGPENLHADNENVNQASYNQQFYDWVAREYDRTYHGPDRYTKLCTKVEMNFILSNMIPGGRTLEIGPGQGRFTQRLAENSQIVVAADISTKMLEICKERVKALNVSYHHVDLLQLNQEKLGGPFDTIVIMWVIPHLEDAVHALRILASLLKPEGKLILNLWNSASLRKKQIRRSNERRRRQNGHWIQKRGWVYTRFYSYGEMLDLLEQAGFASCRELGWCIVPLMGYRGRRFIFPLFRILEELLQTVCREYYYSRMFCCVRK